MFSVNLSDTDLFNIINALDLHGTIIDSSDFDKQKFKKSIQQQHSIWATISKLRDQSQVQDINKLNVQTN